MDKEILTFGNIEIEKKIFFTFIRPLFFWEMWILIKLGSNCTFLALIISNSALKEDDNYYLQLFLKECIFFEKKVVRHIHDSLSDFSYSSDESDEELLKVK